MQKLTHFLATKEGDEIKISTYECTVGGETGDTAAVRFSIGYMPSTSPYLTVETVHQSLDSQYGIINWGMVKYVLCDPRGVQFGSILQENVPIIKGMILHTWPHTRLWDFVCIRRIRMFSKSGLQSNETQPQTIAHARPEVNDGTTHIGWGTVNPDDAGLYIQKSFSIWNTNTSLHCTLYQCLNLWCNVCYAQASRVCNVYT